MLGPFYLHITYVYIIHINILPETEQYFLIPVMPSSSQDKLHIYKSFTRAFTHALVIYDILETSRISSNYSYKTWTDARKYVCISPFWTSFDFRHLTHDKIISPRQSRQTNSLIRKHSPKTDKFSNISCIYNEWVNLFSKWSEIWCSGKSEHFLPHMWHPSRFIILNQRTQQFDSYLSLHNKVTLCYDESTWKHRERGL